MRVPKQPGLSVNDLLFSRPDRFPRPDWAAIEERIDRHGDDPGKAWERVAVEWMVAFSAALGPDYKVHHSGDILLVTRAAEHRVREILRFLHDCEKRILAELPFVDPSELPGYLPVIVFGDELDFYHYLGALRDDDDDDESATAGGVFINEGYGHIAMPSENLDHYRATLCHELCHSLLSGFNLPLWLDEAITAEVEHHVTGENPYFMDRDIVRKHREYWSDERLDAFWTGDSFFSPDEGQGLSYHLARYLFHAIAPLSTPESIGRFVRSADDGNAGKPAAMECFGIELADVVEGLLGIRSQRHDSMR